MNSCQHESGMSESNARRSRTIAWCLALLALTLVVAWVTSSPVPPSGVAR